MSRTASPPNQGKSPPSTKETKSTFTYKSHSIEFENLDKQQLLEIQSFMENHPFMEDLSGEPLLQSAANADTDPAYLRQLARIPDDTIRERLTANPSTPQEILLDLGECYPEAFLQNSQILFEECFGNSIDRKRILLIQRYHAYHQKLVNAEPLDGEEYLDEAMELACKFADTHWAQLMVRDKRYEVRRLLARNVGEHQAPGVTPILLEDSDREVRANLVDNRQVDCKTLLKLAEDPDPVIQRLVASCRNHKARPAHWNLFRKGDPEILLRLAENEELEMDLAMCLVDTSPEVRLKLATRKRLSRPAIERLLARNEQAINLTLAMNRQLVRIAGPGLLRNGDPVTIKEMVANHNCPSTVLTSLVHHEDPVLHDLLLQCENLPLLTVWKILQNEPLTVRRKIASQLKNLETSVHSLTARMIIGELVGDPGMDTHTQALMKHVLLLKKAFLRA